MIIPVIFIGLAICFPKSIGAILKLAIGAAMIFAAAMIL